MGDADKDVRTDFLVARPSFWSGIGRAFDLWGKFDGYNTSRTPEETDMRALYSDWRIVGQDLRDAWVVVHKDQSCHAKKKGKDGRIVCALCGKAVEDRGSVQRKSLAVPLKRAHGRK